MITVLVTGSDTGVGKTVVVGALARILSSRGRRVQIVKVLETGQPEERDAARAARIAGLSEEASVTLESLPEPLAPVAAAAAAGRTIDFEALVAAVGRLDPVDWRLIEGAGGIATQVDAQGRDWADFGAAVAADAVVVVVPDRLGAVNQGRLAHARAAQTGLRAGVWLNAAAPVSAAVAASNREGLGLARVPVWAEQGHGAIQPEKPSALIAILEEQAAADAGAGDSDKGTGDLASRCRNALESRRRGKLLRTLRVSRRRDGDLNFADNDYLELARDPAIAAAVAAAAATYGTSASASPVLTGWGEVHAALLERLCAWHGFPTGLIWTSGYAANGAVLGVLPGRGDLVLADRLIHASMIAGIVRSGARLRRFNHLRLDHLEELLAGDARAGRQTFVVTESVFSMDGDAPDLALLARLKSRYGFLLVLDEAHALGWYGPEGAGLARAAGVEGAVDILIGTFGKTLASGGAYTLFRNDDVRDHLVNEAGEFIYSTALAPTNAAAALAAIERVRALAADQPAWHEASRGFRRRLKEQDWAVPEGDSPIVPVRLDDADAAVALAAWLRERGILVAAVRPPTVPVGTSRLRLSLKRGFGPDQAERVIAAMNAWRESR